MNEDNQTFGLHWLTKLIVVRKEVEGKELTHTGSTIYFVLFCFCFASILNFFQTRFIETERIFIMILVEENFIKKVYGDLSRIEILP